MKGINNIVLSTVAALLCSQANASPVVPAILKRGGASEMATAIIGLFQQAIKGGQLGFAEGTNAWYAIPRG
jgi:hypothetical protein